jgi:hypothetical protein
MNRISIKLLNVVGLILVLFMTTEGIQSAQEDVSMNSYFPVTNYHENGSSEYAGDLTYLAAEDVVLADHWFESPKAQFQYAQIIIIAMRVGQLIYRAVNLIQKVIKVINKASKIFKLGQKASKNVLQRFVTKSAKRLAKKGAEYTLKTVTKGEAAQHALKGAQSLAKATPPPVPSQLSDVEKDRLKIARNKERMVAPDAFRLRNTVATYNKAYKNAAESAAAFSKEYEAVIQNTIDDLENIHTFDDAELTAKTIIYDADIATLDASINQMKEAVKTQAQATPAAAETTASPAAPASPATPELDTPGPLVPTGSSAMLDDKHKSGGHVTFTADAVQPGANAAAGQGAVADKKPHVVNKVPAGYTKEQWAKLCKSLEEAVAATKKNEAIMEKNVEQTLKLAELVESIDIKTEGDEEVAVNFDEIDKQIDGVVNDFETDIVPQLDSSFEEMNKEDNDVFSDELYYDDWDTDESEFEKLYDEYEGFEPSDMDEGGEGAG